MSQIQDAYERAVAVLHLCATPHGFHAAYPGYNALWARDAVITSLGASLLDDTFQETIKQSLNTLAAHQSELGQIPNAIDKWSDQKPHVDFTTIDSTLWFLIGHAVYKKRYHENLLERLQRRSITRALLWLLYQDISEDGMFEQLPTSDWQDAFPHRYGHTINTQALAYHVLRLYLKNRVAERLRQATNNKEDTRLWNGTYYLAWRWKNHNRYHELGKWFDSLGNILAIIFDLADRKQALAILRYIDQENINKPYPLRAIDPPIRKGTRDWQDYYLDCDARTPYHYLNAGIWPFIGGFYILALVKYSYFKEAAYYLEKLAEANMSGGGNFSEWLHGTTGKPSKGGNQAWNAGMYILAYNSLKQKSCLL